MARVGRIYKTKGSSEHSLFSILQWVQILKTRSLYQRQAQNFSFTLKSLTVLCIWKHRMKWTSSSITTHTNCAWPHAYWREKGGKSLYLPPHHGWGRYGGKALCKTPPSSRIPEKPVWRNIVPDLFHPFDWAYFSTVRWAAEELFVFTHVCNHITTPSHPPN